MRGSRIAKRFQPASLSFRFVRQVTIYFCVQPVTTTVLSLAFLNARLGALQVVGALLIAIGLLVTVYARLREARALQSSKSGVEAAVAANGLVNGGAGPGHAGTDYWPNSFAAFAGTTSSNDHYPEAVGQASINQLAHGGSSGATGAAAEQSARNSRSRASSRTASRGGAEQIGVLQAPLLAERPVDPL